MHSSILYITVVVKPKININSFKKQSFVLPIFTIVLGYASLNIQIYQVSYAFFDGFWMRDQNMTENISIKTVLIVLVEYINYYYSIIYYTCDCQRH